MARRQQTNRRRSVPYEWNGAQIRALRKHLGYTQHEMADELEVRQQTISEWETNQHAPHRSTRKILTMIAERAGFVYGAGEPPDSQHENRA
jgi:DNA-binding transcriptional regulator YiaG